MARTRSALTTLVLAAGFALGVSPALGAPPTDEAIKQANDAFRAEYRKAAGDKEKIAAAAKAAAKDLSVAEMTLDQMSDLRWIIIFSDQAGVASARIAEFAKEPTADGAKAAVIGLAFIDADTAPAQAQADAVKAVLAHPGLAEALKENKAPELFYQLRGASKEAQALFAPDLGKLEGVVTADLPASALGQLPTFIVSLRDMPGAPEGLAERLRVKTVDLLTAARAGADERTARGIDRSVSMLSGAMARGQLLDHAAPAMAIEWSSDPSIKSMADLKGKVVLLDFWATWCGPCIASFPKMREMQERYEGYPVAIIGVTSLQGYHMAPSGKIDTKGDPAKEYGLMTEFMQQKDMTWPVVFTTENVFNPDYGVQGIPHIAIVAPDGKVRHNGARDLYGSIDALLKEFHLAVPAEAPASAKPH